MEEYAQQWGVKLGARAEETHASTLYHGWRGVAPVILKIGKPHTEEARNSAVLEAYQNYGGITVLEAEGPAVLMPLLSGIHLTELTEAGDDEQATEIFCAVMQKLHRAKIPAGTPKLERLDAHFDGSNIPATLLDPARQLFRQLCQTQQGQVLLHGDLHHDNIMQDINRGWVVIDPKGYAGEAEFDCGCYLRNPIARPDIALDPAIMTRRIEQIADLTGLNADRITAWAFAMAVMSACWDEAAGRAPDLAFALTLRNFI